MGEAAPSLLVTQAWFWKDENGDSQPGPARLEIWRSQQDGWKRFRVEDADSNVFHKAIPFQDGILTIGAERALLKHWTMSDGKWAQETLWERDWKESSIDFVTLKWEMLIMTVSKIWLLPLTMLVW